MSLKLKYVTVTAALFIALSFAFERQAYAYIDPGSSLLLFQSLSALVTGALFYCRRRIKALFTRPSTPSNEIGE